MQNTHLMHLLETVDAFNEDTPHLRLPKEYFFLLSFLDSLQQIATICKVHYDTEETLVEESIAVADYVWVLD